MTPQEQVALVTGSSRGIGKAIAKELAAKGIRVIINYVTNEDAAQQTLQEIQKSGGEGMLCRFDVSKSQEVEEGFAQILSALGRLDILVNSAGITRDTLLLRMKPDDWEQVLQTNLTGAFHCARLALRPMIKQRWGRIINLSSVVGVMGNAGQVNYAASKAGLIGFTKALAREVAPRGITVNAVAPGFIETDMTRGISAQMKAELQHQIPLERWGTPEEVAYCVAFLASKRAGYITGQVIHVNGGLLM